MDELIIVGGGPHAHEMADLVRLVNQVTPTWNLLGFLVPEAQAERVGARSACGDEVLGTYADIACYSDAWFVPEVNCECSNLPLARLVSLIAPSAFVAGSARIGKGSVIRFSTMANGVSAS